jgi:nucleotide-binding universal stress UspA family protein
MNTAELGNTTRESMADLQGRVVVGIDGSDTSKVALRWAAEEAAQKKMLIDVVIVWQRPVSYGWYVGDLSGIDWFGDFDKLVTTVVDETFGAHRPPGLRTYVLEGDPAHRLIEHASGAQLLIVGSRGTGGFLGLSLGSVSAKCAAHATCPVLIVHAED